MDTATQYTEKMEKFMNTLTSTLGTKNVKRIKGRRFDRIKCDDAVRYFVDRNSWEIYGAKSSFQFNPRRWYGTLDVVSQYTWVPTPTPIAGTPAEEIHNKREAEIVQNYKPRGRPKKNP